MPARRPDYDTSELFRRRRAGASYHNRGRLAHRNMLPQSVLDQAIVNAYHERRAARAIHRMLTSKIQTILHHLLLKPGTPSGLTSKIRCGIDV
jgi:hypothetical protein